MDKLTAVRCEITGTAGKYAAIKGKTYRMMRTKSGGFVPRDPTYPLDGPADCAKTVVKETIRKVTDEKLGDGGAEILKLDGSTGEAQGPGGSGKIRS